MIGDAFIGVCGTVLNENVPLLCRAGRQSRLELPPEDHLMAAAICATASPCSFLKSGFSDLIDSDSALPHGPQT